MASDKRELILLRLQAVLAAVPGVAVVYRDRGDLPDNKLPAVILLDGIERRLQGGETRRGQPSTSIISLEPQIFLVEKPRSSVNAVEYGPLLSQWRMKLLKAIITDPQLLDLVGPNGDIQYRGSQTDMQTGRAMEGQLQIDVALSYVLKPSDLL